MANPVCEVLVTEARLNAPENQVDAAAGAAVDFWGIVRGSEDGHQIEGIEYEPNHLEPSGAHGAFCSRAKFFVAVCAHFRAFNFSHRGSDRSYRWGNRPALRDHHKFWQIDGPARRQDHDGSGIYFAGTPQSCSGMGSHNCSSAG